LVAAWTEAGATVGWMKAVDYGVEFRKGVEGQEGEVPAFLFRTWTAGVVGTLPQPRRAFGLELYSPKVTDEALGELAVMEELQMLHVGGSPVTGAGFQALAGLKGLHHLVLGGNATGEGMKGVAGLRALKRLSIGPRMTDAGLEELAGMTQLQMLHLGGSPVTDAGLKALAGMKRLQILHLIHTRVTDAGLKELTGMKELQVLTLTLTRVTDAGLKELAGLENLQQLSLAVTPVTDAGLSLRTWTAKRTSGPPSLCLMARHIIQSTSHSRPASFGFAVAPEPAIR
jgi:hypothetical protein